MFMTSPLDDSPSVAATTSNSRFSLSASKRTENGWDLVVISIPPTKQPLYPHTPGLNQQAHSYEQHGHCDHQHLPQEKQKGSRHTEQDDSPSVHIRRHLQMSLKVRSLK